MNDKVLLLLALVAATAAEGQSHEDSYESHKAEEPKYEYSYKVKDNYGNDFGHEEKRDGDNTEGSYYNHLPDGRLQKVKYHVNGYSGYVADVNYEGEAHYDSGSYAAHSREVRESSMPQYRVASPRSGESRFTFGSAESRKSDTFRFNSGSHESRESHESRFTFGSHKSGESHRVSQESKESKENSDESKSSESRKHHRPVYYMPIFDSRESGYTYDDDSDDDDYMTSTEYFIANYRPQIRYQPSYKV